MLQRIQTLYLIVSGILITALYIWFPLVLDADGNAVIERNEPLVLGLLLLCVGLTITVILAFKKRKIQFVLNLKKMVSSGFKSLSL